jgi:hypothetical protein
MDTESGQKNACALSLSDDESLDRYDRRRKDDRRKGPKAPGMHDTFCRFHRGEASSSDLNKKRSREESPRGDHKRSKDEVRVCLPEPCRMC